MTDDEMQRLAAAVEQDGRGIDVWFNRTLLSWWLPDYRRGETWSTHVARAAVDQTACWVCRHFARLCCWWLGVAVQKDHCPLCLDPDSPPSPPSVYERAGMCFAVLAIILVGGAGFVLAVLAHVVWRAL